LVVEDDKDIGEFFIEALKQETPYQVVLATDGFHALKMVRSLKPNLFVLDYLLPSKNAWNSTSICKQWKRSRMSPRCSRTRTSYKGACLLHLALA
jgi:DNA-binding response OmpR family regulator